MFDIYVTEYGTALTTILPILFLYLNTVIVTAEPLNRNESGRFGALTSDSTHHFSEFWLSLCKIVRSSVILLLPLFIVSTITKRTMLYRKYYNQTYYALS